MVAGGILSTEVFHEEPQEGLPVEHGQPRQRGQPVQPVGQHAGVMMENPIIILRTTIRQGDNMGRTGSEKSNCPSDYCCRSTTFS